MRNQFLVSYSGGGLLLPSALSFKGKLATLHLRTKEHPGPVLLADVAASCSDLIPLHSVERVTNSFIRVIPIQTANDLMVYMTLIKEKL